MMWVGLLAGAVLGAVFFGWAGALLGAFVGWLVGLIVQSNREQATAPRAARPRETLEARVARLERTVAELQARLGVTSGPVEAPSPEPATSRTTPAQPETTLAPPRKEEAPPPPTKPNPIVAWFTGGNTIARVGLVILFFGLAFLIKYAADQDLLPVEFRVMGVAAAAIALLFLGWRLRTKNRTYALGLQGTGVAALYLTVFGALRLWGLLPVEAAFVLLVLIAVFSAVLAVAQDAMSLAVIAAAGGFMAPILASTGEGSHVMLFGYYLLLNLGIAGIALFKAWRALNITGFLFTFFIGAAWGYRYYRPAHLETVEPFLAAFFVLYVAIAVLFARRQPPELKKFVDGTLVFGTPLGAFALQAALMRGIEMGLAWSSVAAAAFYLVLAAALIRTGRESWKLLAQAFIALGVVFVTMAIPLALDARWTSALWALEGAAIVWIGLRQDQKIARWFGLALQVLAGLAYLDSYRMVPALPLLDSRFVGALVLAIAGLWTHRQLLAARARISRPEEKVVAFFFVWGLLWWIFAGRHEIQLLLPWGYQLGAKVALLGATGLVLGLLAIRWDWPHAAIATRWLLPTLALAALAFLPNRAGIGNTNPFAGIGWLAWPFAIAVYFWALRRMRQPESAGLRDILHAGGAWLIALVGALELHWLAAHYTARGTAWSAAALAVPAALMMWLPATRHARQRWPVAEHPRAYLAVSPLVLALLLAFWSIAANVTHDGRSDPLPYLPLLNALDLAHLLALIALAAAALAARAAGQATPLLTRPGAAITGTIVFLWLNAVLLRTLHHWADIPYRWPAMERSVLVQASLSVFWSVLALALMVFATRTARRGLWMTGAALMGVVVVKLFVIDLSNVGGVERIVSFIAVGVLMLVIGYFSPAPPRKSA